MHYDLDTLEELSQELGFAFSRPSPDELQITVFADAILIFMTLRLEEDAVAGFKGTPSHSHGKVGLMLDDSSYSELDELDVIQSLKRGDILVCEEYVNQGLRDRWLVRKKERLDLQCMAPGDELRVRRMA